MPDTIDDADREPDLGLENDDTIVSDGDAEERALEDEDRAGGDQADEGSAEGFGSTAQSFRDGANRLVGQAGDKAREFAEDGKARAGTALDDLSRMMNDAATTVDDKVGEQYGQYARSAADVVSGFSDRIKDADIDELVDEVRGFVTRSPAVAIGAAAAIGFVLVRLIKSGLDAPAHDEA